VHSKNRPSVAALVGALALTSVVLVHCSTDLAYLSSGGASDGGSETAPVGPQSPSGGDGGGGGGGGGDGGRGSDGAPPPTNLMPGQIFCASTTTVCDIRQAQCCVTLAGMDSAAVRSYSFSSAKCGPINGPGCGEYTSNGTDFSDKFPQQCATAADCAAGLSCCVVPLSPTGGTANRFDKAVSSIECVAAAQCAVKGRAICAGASDCAPTENCLAETDPILVRLYAAFCR
jgi:hypothetical protein